MDADDQAKFDALGKRIEELAEAVAAGAPRQEIEAKEEKVEKAAERAGLSDEDADKLADRLVAKLNASNDPDALAEKISGRLIEWADSDDEGEEELAKLGGGREDEAKAEGGDDGGSGDDGGDGDKPDPEPETAPEPERHWSERTLGELLRS